MVSNLRRGCQEATEPMAVGNSGRWDVEGVVCRVVRDAGWTIGDGDDRRRRKMWRLGLVRQ